ncbi:MAG TPA: GGDEF domain-containing protein, partial [Anaerolineales bacterium]|nr:GGDEF domain-containing protein [Anaerolineales bacterium]
DEFIILLQRIKSIQGAKEKAERILIKLEEPYNLDGITIQITASIGISLYKKDDQIDTLLIGADEAMYVAKKLGKNRVYFIER